MKAGHPKDQSVAAAYSFQRKQGCKVPEKGHGMLADYVSRKKHGKEKK